MSSSPASPDRRPLDELIGRALDEIRAEGQLRQLRPTLPLAAGRVRRGGRELVDFSSNDYLGLLHHPLLGARSQEWTRRMGTGSGASRLVTGSSDAVLELERKIARWKGTEAALIFATGWQANASVIPALVALLGDVVVFSDRLIHASMHAGCAAAGVRQVRYRHNDLAHLEALLQSKGADAPARLILTETVFSMDGDVADLAALAALARRYDAFLFVDEAHATGVLGPHGAGLSAAVPGGVDLVMGTFSKAMGAFGAYVAGSARLCEYLVNTCSGFIFSTAPPPGVLGAIDAAVELVPGMDAERHALASRAAKLRRGLGELGIGTGESSTHIVPLIVGEGAAAVALSESLAEAGFLAAAIRPPTVPPGTSRLRLAVRATHSDDDIERLLTLVRQFG